VLERAAEAAADNRYAVPEQWDFEQAIEPYSDDGLGPVHDVVLDLSWCGGAAAPFELLGLLETAGDEKIPEPFNAIFNEENIHSGGVHGAFKAWAMTDSNLATLREAALQGRCVLEHELYNDAPHPLNEARQHAGTMLALRATFEAEAGRYGESLRSFEGAYSLALSALEEPKGRTHVWAHSLFWSIDNCLAASAERFTDIDVLEERMRPYFEWRHDRSRLRAVLEEEFSLASLRFEHQADLEGGPLEGVFTNLSEFLYEELDEVEDRFLALLDKPYHEVEGEMDGLIYGTGAVDRVEDLLEEMRMLYLTHLQNEGTAHVFPIAMALYRYRKEHGTYPDRLESVVPDEVPNDLVSGKPILYLRSANDFVIAEPVAEAGTRESRFAYWRTGR